VADAREIDEAALRIGAHELHAYTISDVEPGGPLLDPTLDRWIEDARPRPRRGSTGDDAVEFVTDPVAEQAGGSRLGERAVPARTIRRARRILGLDAGKAPREDLTCIPVKTWS